MEMGETFDLLGELHQDGEKIVLLVLDGLGGLPIEPGGPTELEAAATPNLDSLCREGTTGLSTPVRPGIEPGSGPAHLSLFGYDPVRYDVGRGVLSALGVGLDLDPSQIAARGNFASMGQDGTISDRRAGRISTDECERLVRKLNEEAGAALDEKEVRVYPVKEHRFVFILSGSGLGGDLTGTDPMETGRQPFPVRDHSGTPEGERTAEVVNEWVSRARSALADEPRANSLNLRGLSQLPDLPSIEQVCGMRAGAIAGYPMYRGAARLVGMQVIEFAGDEPADEIAALRQAWNDFDYFFVHIKKTDSLGEDGNFEGKRLKLEAIDSLIPQITALQPGALVVTGDHSTPAKLRSHSFHPVPTVIWGPRALPDDVASFGERSCAHGALGLFEARSILPLAMAHAGRLKRFGA